jgi:hypothetical protein
LTCQHLKSNGNWIVTDFVDEGKWWQPLMLSVMYGFFRITSRIGARKLPEWDLHFENTGFNEILSARFYSGFIRSRVYEKNSVSE